MNPAGMTLILALSGAAIVMVVAMVQFSAALIAVPREPRALKVWGFVYAASWSALVVVIVLGARSAKATWPQTIAVATLVSGGWATLQASWVWLALSLERTNARAKGEVIAPAKETTCRIAGRLAVAGSVAVALAVAELGYVRKIYEVATAPGHRAIAATSVVAALGFVLFMAGTLKRVLSRGQPMTHAQIEESMRQGKYGSRKEAGALQVRASAYRHFGPAVGARSEEELSIAAMKQAWRSGDWCREPYWVPIFLMAGGGAMMMYGGFAAAMVAGPLYVKVIFGGALAYATFQLIAAIRRA